MHFFRCHVFAGRLKKDRQQTDESDVRSSARGSVLERKTILFAMRAHTLISPAPKQSRNRVLSIPPKRVKTDIDPKCAQGSSLSLNDYLFFFFFMSECLFSSNGSHLSAEEEGEGVVKCVNVRGVFCAFRRPCVVSH